MCQNVLIKGRILPKKLEK